MHAIRRAAARAACSSPMAVAVPRQQVASFAMQISKAGSRPAVAFPLARYFSQTPRVAQEEEDGDRRDAEEDSTLRSSPTESERLRESGFSVFISNMTFDATEVHLREAFSKYGTILGLSIGRDGRGLSRGFGFITFADERAANRAVDEANKSFWHGRRINVEHKKDVPNRRDALGGSSEPTNSLYIGNIPYETSDTELNKLFTELDGVIDVRVAVDRNTGWPRGFAHADFVDVDYARKALEKLSTVNIGGRPLRIDYATGRTQGGGIPR
ncbi:RNA-binding domain-containing protein [Durotheca rogersii]|uniref:RNA-binding domain-containing protein n=1 Tax=Durotheca rogersii TaxID=419775 RepID=UPI00221FEFC2|nr:RNA-binding domain-containing protein [Durotheca rogersii]KAI5861738.1 RNA-binding domain-containing protein [Durotheca rogersii]